MAEVDITDLRKMAGGASREIWSFTLGLPGGVKRDLIVRRDPPSAEPGVMEREAFLMRRAAGLGVPVPEIVATSFDSAALGASAIVMARVQGNAEPQYVLTHPALDNVRGALAFECGQILARIHSIEVPPGDMPGYRDPLEYYRGVLDRIGESRPAFELAMDWLHHNRPAATAGGPAVLHGDFRLGNFLVSAEGIAAVLDWEMAKLGDPLEDLAWLCLEDWRFGGEKPVGGFGSLDDFFAGYEAAGGRPLERGALRWWNVLSTLKWGVICLEQADLHISGKEKSIELAVLGRRACELEWQLLHLLYGSPPSQMQMSDDLSESMIHGRASAGVLADAVRSTVRDLTAVTSPKQQLELKIAARIVGMILRQAQFEPAQMELEKRLREPIGAAESEDVHRLIRSGLWREAEDQIKLYAWSTARMRLSVANPKFLFSWRPCEPL
ncbi:MAG: phosphotransferase [Flavobacteriaceae bacterium]